MLENIKYRIGFLVAISFLIAAPFAAEAQVDEGALIREKIENIAEEADAELDYTSLVEALEYFNKHKINLNNTTPEELAQLVFLDPVQINNLFEHIRQNGKLLSINELQSIDGFDVETIEKLLLFAEVKRDAGRRNMGLGEIFRNGSSDLFMRYQRVLEEQQGYSPATDSLLEASPNSRYLGSPDKYYMKYRFKYYNNLSIGFTAEKDAGEEFFTGTQPNGFDYYSFHAFYQDKGFVRKLALGDYYLQFGQGLMMWNGLAFGKSSDAVNVKRIPQAIKPYRSSDENNFMRGAATTIGLGRFELTGFYSRKKIDANIGDYDTLTNEILYISSFQETGLHATTGEVEDKDAIGEEIFGGRLEYKSPLLNVGVSLVNTKFDQALDRSLSLYQRYEFEGDHLMNAGVDYSLLWRNLNLFGEVAVSDNGGRAIMNGLLVSLDSKVSLSVVHRDYSRDYHTFYSAAFGEGSKTANEKGIYLGLQVRHSKKWKFSAYSDFFRYDWLAYQASGPSIGQEYLGQIDYRHSRRLSMYLRGKAEFKQYNSDEDDLMINYLVYRKRLNARYHTSVTIIPEVTLKNRIEFSHYELGDGSPETGFLIYQDIKYQPKKLPLTFNMRYAIFDADYHARLYAFEPEILYGYSVPSYYSKGSRFIIVMKWHIMRNMDFWLRYSQTYYRDRNVIGSGLTEIDGNVKSEIKAQLRLRF